MTGGTHSQGAFAQMIFSARADTAPHSYASADGAYLVEFLGESLAVGARIVSADRGITGSRAHRSERARAGAPYRQGWVKMLVSAVDLAHFLPLMMGAAAVGTAFDLTEDVPYFGVLIDTDYSTFEFLDCKINRWIIRGRAPQFGEGGEPELMELSLEIFASDDATGTAWPVSPPALTSQGPYVFSDTTGAIVLNGTAREVSDFVLVGDNRLFVKYANALTAHSICPTDRTIAGSFQVPWNSDHANLYGMATAGAAATVTFTNGGLSTLFTFGRLQVPRERPFVRGKSEIYLTLEGEFRSVSTTPELAVTNDSTP